MKRVLKAFGLVWAAACVGAAVGALTARRRVQVRDERTADEIALVATFGPLEFHSTARAFRGGTIECWYGGGSVDLRGATLDPSGATLRVRAVFGGGQIVVPGSWRVRAHAVGIGGINDMRDQALVDDAAPVLTIEGVCVFGGFGVTSEPAGRRFTPAVPA